MQPLLKGAIAYLITPPVRPRYQERTMEAAYIAQDAAAAETSRVRHQDSVARIDELASSFVQSTSGAVRLIKVPLVTGALLLIALGFGQLAG